MPRVSVASSATSTAKRFETRARTWAELRPEIEAQGLSLNGVEAVMRPGNVTLTRNDAELPNEDFKIFLVPTKNKAGASIEDMAKSIGGSIEAAIVKGAKLADAAKLKELKASLIEEIEGFFEVDFDHDAPLDDDDDENDDFKFDDEGDSDVAEARRMERSR